MSNSFYVCLLSNVSDYPDNQPNKFRVHLPKPLYFSGDWVCGVHSISYPYSWSSTIGTLDEQWIDINFTDNNKKGQTIRIPVPKGSHNTPEEILQFLISTLRHQSLALDNTALEESSEGFFDKPTIINRRNKRQHEELKDLTPYNENEEENESLRSLSPYQEDVEETSPPQKDKINLTKQPEKEKEEENKNADDKEKEEEQKKEEQKKKEERKKEESKVEEKKKEDKVGKEQPKVEKKKEAEKEKVIEKKKDDEKSKVEEKEKPKEEHKKEQENVLSVLGVGKKKEEKPAEKPKDSSVLSTLGVGKKEEKPEDVLSAIGLGKKEEKKEVLRELSPYKEEEPLPPPPKKERKEQSNDTRVKDNSTQTPSVLSALGLERKESWTQTPSPLLETIGLKPKEGKKDVFDILLGKGKTPYTATLLKQIIDSISINYLADFKRFKLSFTDSSIKYVSFSPQLGYVLGFANSQHVQNNEIAKYAYDLRGGFSSFAIYAKGLTENMIVGNSLSSLLRIVSVSGAIPGEYHEKIYDSPIYVRVLPREVNEIEVELRTMDNGRLVPFAYGTGASPYQRGYGQRGAGVGDVMRGLWRFFLPIIRRVGSTVSAEALNTGQRVLERVNQGQPIKEAFFSEGKRGVDTVLEKGGLPKQFGTGRKSIKGKRIPSHQTFIGKKKKRVDAFGFY
uniref:Uncharacterized protein n=1 Tax=Meloidogyne enterolobii TaxID=390850 RepID=A0A6V7Y568_MELEN|nr:unnamed protein product [Meloidogyne enterolobii]